MSTPRTLPAPLTPLILPAGERPDRHAAERLLRDLGVDPSAWSNAAGDRYAAHEHGYTKLLICAAGSITFELDGGAVHLLPGEGFVLPPGTPHAAVVGPEGCTCVEGRC